MKKICICGGGALGHVTAAFLSVEDGITVNLLTSRPEMWLHDVEVSLPEGRSIRGHISVISSDPLETVSGADVVLICLPGFLIEGEIAKIRPYLSPDSYVGCIFSSTGFFFDALKMLPENQPLWGFQRVPFIARVREYGRSAAILGYKDSLGIAVEHVDYGAKSDFARWVQTVFQRPVTLLGNYLEASLTNSNPLLHTSRLYSMFSGWRRGQYYPSPLPFYEGWSLDAAELLMAMDREFFSLLAVLPVRSGAIKPIAEYYDSVDAASLASKLSSIPAFKGIMAPMIQVGDNGWIPDFASRYFTEDFPYGLRFIRDLAHSHGVAVPKIDTVYVWGMSIIAEND